MINFPGRYYLSTRYDGIIDSVSYLIKFWIPYILVSQILWHSIEYHSYGQYTLSFLLWIGHMSAYDYFCFINDTKSTSIEANPSFRHSLITINQIRTTGLISVLLLCLGSLLCGITIQSATYIVLYYFFLAITFTAHNHAGSLFRLLTFTLLYVIKGLIFVPFLNLNYLHFSRLIQYLLFCLLYSIINLPSYTIKKFNLLSSNPKIRKFASTTLIYKLALIGGFGLYNRMFLIIGIPIALGTLCQHLVRKRS